MVTEIRCTSSWEFADHRQRPDHVAALAHADETSAVGVKADPGARGVDVGVAGVEVVGGHHTRQLLIGQEGAKITRQTKRM